MSPDEINNLYRSNDIQRWQNSEWVLGYEVRLSNTPKLQLDICKELAGVYPKWFRFSSWRNGCGCYIVPVLPSMAEFKEYNKALLEGKKGFQFKGIVKDVPLNFKKWVFNNQNVNPVPQFVKDNFIKGNIKLGLKYPYKERLVVQYQNLLDESISDTELRDLNQIAFFQANRIEKHLKGLACKQHPTIVSSLIVTPTKERNLNFTESFCCEDFWYQIVEEVKTILQVD
ncbi:hypothetical protein EFA69_09540 [Rufibacter immobilis]|uniref:Uncharacterized protein n=1 Tax=Rufibacter immobilis TaxID=1348778 RepID=A0A3M9MW34_9BACT|nr:hypothetical protein [Rufibacter immobilis]RNI29771.1 hypothetical protein EFA69_09540 [Rufibacter immobilis]